MVLQNWSYVWSCQEKVVTLSGLLNAIDGLLSCCGDERVIVFTTNYKDRIDPALLRAGRMDMHINLSYCTFSTFKQLAANYLDIWNHDLFPRIEKLISEVQVSPAEVAGELMKIRNPKTSLEGLSRFLESKVSPWPHQFMFITDKQVAWCSNIIKFLTKSSRILERVQRFCASYATWIIHHYFLLPVLYLSERSSKILSSSYFGTWRCWGWTRWCVTGRGHHQSRPWRWSPATKHTATLGKE